MANKEFEKDANFISAVEVILKHEGGYVNHPNDPGGETNFGISKRSYPDVDIKSLTKDDAKAIYYQDYWKKNKCDLIAEEDIGTKFFDMCVNTGGRIAARTVQRALRSVGKVIKEDSVLGDASFAAINAVNFPKELLCAIRSEIAGYYRYLASSNKKNEVFLEGWLKRAYS